MLFLIFSYMYVTISVVHQLTVHWNFSIVLRVVTWSHDLRQAGTLWVFNPNPHPNTATGKAVS